YLASARTSNENIDAKSPGPQSRTHPHSTMNAGVEISFVHAALVVPDTALARFPRHVWRTALNAFNHARLFEHKQDASRLLRKTQRDESDNDVDRTDEGFLSGIALQFAHERRDFELVRIQTRYV